jgi:hypothetical protein
VPQNLLRQHSELRRARQVGAIAREIDAGEHELGVPSLDERANLVDHRAHRHRARIAATERNDAEGTAVIAAILHLHEHPRQAGGKAIEEMRRHLLHGHDVADGDLFARADIERSTCLAPRGTLHLVVIADHAVDLSHVGEHPALRLRGAAGDDDARFGPLALQFSDRLARLRHRLVGDGTAIDDNGVHEPRAFRLAADHLGLEGVETAAEGDDLDAHHATGANSAGSKVPSYSKVAVPVISTWSSRSRHSIPSLPPGSVISTVLLARFSRAAATAVAQAAEPQALVRPAPRSQVRIVM